MYNQEMEPIEIYKYLTEGGQAEQDDQGNWRLEIPAGPKGHYRVAQIDDYHPLPRHRFPWKTPQPGNELTLTLKARASSSDISGTWGFGLWNDPFSISIGLRGGGKRFPALPNTAWFFYASEHNYLSLYDDLPACEALAATFRAPNLPATVLAIGTPALALGVLPPWGRMLRRFGRRFVEQSAILMKHDPTKWHDYAIHWRADQVILKVDGMDVLDTPISPHGPLSFVAWIDNQYAALPPDGHLSLGTLDTPEPAWIEMAGIEINISTIA